MRKLRFAILLLVTSIVSAQSIPGFDPANSAAANGRAIGDEAARRNDGFGDSRADMTMTLYDGRGNSVKRSMQSMTLEMPDDGDRTILVFEDPRDVRGTAFLTHGQYGARAGQGAGRKPRGRRRARCCSHCLTRLTDSKAGALLAAVRLRSAS